MAMEPIGDAVLQAAACHGLEQVFAAIITKIDDTDGLHWLLKIVYRLLAEGFLTDSAAERLRAAADSRRSELRRAAFGRKLRTGRGNA